MKRKFLVLTLCFTLIFTSINYKRSYADGGIISAPMLATVGTLALATGITISNDDDLYKIGRMFYERNKENWSNVLTAFTGVVALNVATNKVTVGKDFLDIVKSTFSTFKGTWYVQDNAYIVYNGLDTINGLDLNSITKELKFDFSNKVRLTLKPVSWVDNVATYYIGFNNLGGYGGGSSTLFRSDTLSAKPSNVVRTLVKGYWITVVTDIPGTIKNFNLNELVKKYGYDMSVFDSITLPYNGTYDDSIYKEKDELDIYVPGNLGDLTNGVVVPGDIIGDVAPGWSSGVLNPSLPGVNNPSIDVDDSISFPTVGDIDAPDVDVPGTDTIIPSFPSFGDSLDFSPMYLTNVTEKFPFSLPWDIGRLISKFDVDPVAPVFDVPVFSETITLDLTEFSELAGIVRFFVLIGFILSLIFISTRLLG